jgi:hypothetical protein
MSSAFDIISVINQLLARCLAEFDRIPEAILLSRDVYRRLVELRSVDSTIGDLVIGCFPICDLATQLGTVRIVIDESMTDGAIEIG